MNAATSTPALMGLILFGAGMLLRFQAAREETRLLRQPEMNRREVSLRGTYVAARLAAALTATGAIVFLGKLFGATATVMGPLAALPLLALIDLVPRALTQPGAPESAAWSNALGGLLGSRNGKEKEADAWTHEGLTPLVLPSERDEERDERHMARRVYDFGDVAVGDIMVPLVDVIAVRDDSKIDEIMRIATREEYSRLPVFRERLPNVIGLLHVFDLLVPGDARTAADLMRPPTFVPEMTPASDVLRRLQEEGVNLAVVIDEYGGAVGIVAIEDILEEVVGEIADEYDDEEDPVREIGPGAWAVDGRAEIERLNERFTWSLPSGEYETLAGLLLSRFERVPTGGETLELKEVTLLVLRCSLRSIDEVRVDRTTTTEDGKS